jgi:hypothetical protein
VPAKQGLYYLAISPVLKTNFKRSREVRILICLGKELEYL